MLEHWLIELIGHVSGLSDAQLKQIEKSLPATKALVDLLNRARPIIEQAQNLYTEAEPLIDEAKKEWQTVGPAAQILIDVISHHVNRGSSRQKPLKQCVPRLTGQSTASQRII
jgi:predicted Zn-dependent protease with MMP-like domain